MDIRDIIAIIYIRALSDIIDITDIIAIRSLRALRDIMDIITETEWLPAGVLHWIGIPAPLDCCSVGLLSRGPRGSWRRCRRRGGWLQGGPPDHFLCPGFSSESLCTGPISPVIGPI